MTARVTAQALVEEQLVLAVEANPSDPQYLVALASFLGERKSRRKDAQVLLGFLAWFLSFVFFFLSTLWDEDLVDLVGSCRFFVNLVGRGSS